MKLEKSKHYGLNTTCRVLRNKRVGFGTLRKGIIQFVRMVEPCNTPLWSEQEKQSGECEGCQAEWEVPGNFRVKENN